MTSIRCRIHVDETGRAVLQLPREVFPGEHEVIVSVSETLPSPEQLVETVSDEWDTLLSAGEGSLDFWDNRIDDEIWNHA